MGDVVGWISVGLGQLVSWPQVWKLRCERGDGISLLSYAIVMVSMSLYLLHGIAIGDAVTIASVPLSLIPNLLITVLLVRRRATGADPRAVSRGACSGRRVDTSEAHGGRTSWPASSVFTGPRTRVSPRPKWPPRR
jgi:MtN3 and saliva related transmembrane protein